MSGAKNAGPVSFSWPKRGAFVRASVVEYRGSRFLDVREWLLNGSGDLVATKKGVTLPLEAVQPLSEALRSIAEAQSRSQNGAS